MLLTPHTLVGVAIATLIPNPLISAPLSFVMHFAGDMVPHWDFYSHTETAERLNGWRPLAVMADLAVGVAVGVTFVLWALWLKNDMALAANVFLCGVASVLPDVLTGPSVYLNKEGKSLIHKLQCKLQFQAPLPWGIITQLIVSVASLVLILGLKV